MTVTVDGLAVRSGNASGAAGSLPGEGGGLLALSGANLTLNQMVFTANRSNGNGGAIFSQAPLQITHVTFYSNTSGSGNGGALADHQHAGDQQLHLPEQPGCSRRSDPRQRTGDNRWQHIPQQPGEHLRGRRHQNQPAFNCDRINLFEKPGPLWRRGDRIRALALKISQSIFQQNQVTVFTGGAIDSPVGGMDIQSSIFISNTAIQNGGAIFSGSGSVTINNSQMTGNKSLGGNCLPACSSGDGGAIFSSGPLTVTQTTLLNNFAKLNGGGLAGHGGTVVMNSTFTGNKAGTVGDANNPTSKGGGIFVSGGASLINNVFEGNAAQSTTNADGGGLYMQSGSLLSSGNQYSHNTATRFGGGGRVVTGLISGDRFINNTSGSEGGGLQATGNLTVTHTLFDGNASSLSGAIVEQGPSITKTVQLNVDNSLFIRNQRVVSSGVTDMRLFDLTARLVNNTFADPGTGGATSVTIFRSDLLANNNIFANYGTSLNVGQACIRPAGGLQPVLQRPNRQLGVTSGGHSLTSNPLFVNPGGQDYRLQSISPAREAGLDSALPASILTDLGGGARRMGNIDLGAYEFQVLLFLPTISK